MRRPLALLSFYGPPLLVIASIIYFVLAVSHPSVCPVAPGIEHYSPNNTL